MYNTPETNALQEENKMVSYDRLWKTMKERKVSQYHLIKYYGFSAGQMSRLRENANVSIYTLNRLGKILKCRMEDMIEYIAEE